MAAELFYLPFRPAINANGLTISGAKLYFYAAGTTTPQAVYANSSLTTPLTNPVTANSAGVWPAIYMNDALTYRVVLKDAAGVTLSDADPYLPSIVDALTTDLQGIADAAAASASNAASEADSAYAAAADAEAYAASLLIESAGTWYSSLSVGAAAVTEGQGFIVVSGGYVILAKKVSGVGVEQARFPNGNLTATVETTANITSGSFAGVITRIKTTGFAVGNDGGGACYVRTAESLSAGSGVWWFTAADGSKWKLAEDQDFTTPMFGAMGDPSLSLTAIAQSMTIGTDDAARIQAALDAPMVKVLTVTRQHWFGSDILKPSGKTLRGLGRAITGFHRIPLVGNQANPTFGVYSEDDNSGAFADFFINCQRSGWNAGLSPADAQHLKNRCSGLVIRRDSKNVRVSRVDVYNSWGYSHYTCAGSAGNAEPTPKGIVREDCRAYNGDTCFEATGLDTEETLVNCWGYKDPIDGGSSVYMECAFHSYSGVALVHRIRCGFRGSAPAVLDSIADGVNSNRIINDECDFETSGGQSAIIVNNPDPAGVGNPANVGKRVLDYQINNCRVDPALVFTGGALPYAVLASYANININGGILSGIGIQSGVDAVTKIRGGAVITAERPSGPAVIALGRDGTGTVEWFGKAGSITATHGTDMGLALTGYGNPGVTFHDVPTELSPAPVVDVPIYAEIVQRVVGHKTAAEMTNAGYTVPPNYWFTLDLSQLVASRDKTEFSFSLQRDNNSTTGPEWSPSIRWLSDSQVQVYINAPVALTDCILRYVVTEWA